MLMTFKKKNFIKKMLYHHFLSITNQEKLNNPDHFQLSLKKLPLKNTVKNKLMKLNKLKKEWPNIKSISL
jgi:hypothetical protein